MLRNGGGAPSCEGSRWLEGHRNSQITAADLKLETPETTQAALPTTGHQRLTPFPIGCSTKVLRSVYHQRIYLGNSDGHIECLWSTSQSLWLSTSIFL